MSQVPQEEPFSEANLDSPEYRERLMRKLNCLIAVLEVATAKVKRSLTEPAADTERLTRICTNLQSTLDVCVRARTALERREKPTTALSTDVARITRAAGGKRKRPKRRAARPTAKRKGPDRTAAEKRRFARLGPIEAAMIQGCDLDGLARQLQF